MINKQQRHLYSKNRQLSFSTEVVYFRFHIVLCSGGSSCVEAGTKTARLSHILNLFFDASCQIFKGLNVEPHFLLGLELLIQHVLLVVGQHLFGHSLLMVLGFFEEGHDVRYGLLVHGNSLLEHVKGSRDDVKLGNDFLKGLRKLFSRA